MAITAFRFGTAFSPLQLGPVVWLDASDGSTMFDATSGGSVVTSGDVYRIEDKSGNGNHFIQPVTANCPQKVLNARNGLSVLRFNNDWLYTTVNLSPYNFTIANAPGATPNLGGLIGVRDADVGLRKEFTVSAWRCIGVADFPASTEDIWVNYAPTNAYNGLPHVVSANRRDTVSYGTSGTSLGNYFYSTTGRHYVGDVFEVFVFNRRLVYYEREKLTRYLLAKYAI